MHAVQESKGSWPANCDCNICVLVAIPCIINAVSIAVRINSLVCSICVPVMILKMPFIFLFGWFVKSNRLLCMPFKSPEVHGSRLLCMPFKSPEVHGWRTVIVIFIKYV